MGHQHAPATVPLAAQLVHSITIGGFDQLCRPLDNQEDDKVSRTRH
jgi:hypothetical protein